MKIIIAADHAGFELKEELKEYLGKLGHDVDDLGTNSTKPVDYPLFGEKVAKKAAKEKTFGILICGTGLGMCITANKVKGIRAANCYNEEIAKLARQHNNANVLCLGARVLDKGKAKKITKVFLETGFSKEERHKRRVKEMDDM